jgi:hypothetical protein
MGSTFSVSNVRMPSIKPQDLPRYTPVNIAVDDDLRSDGYPDVDDSLKSIPEKKTEDV